MKSKLAKRGLGLVLGVLIASSAFAAVSGRESTVESKTESVAFSPKKGLTLEEAMLQEATLRNAAFNSTTKVIKNPGGVYALFAPDTVEKATTGVSTAKAWTVSGCDGVALRTFWNKVEPTDNARNWSHFDEGVAAARKNKKSVSLSIASGIFTPKWVFDAGAQRFKVSLTSNFGTSVTMDLPPPWDAVYQSKWGRLVQDMGRRYDADASVGYVVIGGLGDVVETYFVTNQTDLTALNAIGGSAKWLEGAKAVVKLYADAFPTTPVIIALANPVPGNEGLTTLTSLVNYCTATYPGRVGFMQDGLTAVSGSNYYPNTVITGNTTKTVTGFQMVWSAVGDTNNLIKGTLTQALQNGVNLKGHFVEVYQEDVILSTNATLLSNTSSKMKTNAKATGAIATFASVFPKD